MESRPYAADLRTIQAVWTAIIAGVALMTIAFVGLVGLGVGRVMETSAALLFYLNAGANLLALVLALGVQRRMLDRLPGREAYEEIVAEVRLAGLLSLAILEGSVLVAGVCAVVTGEAVNLLFAVPFFGFAALFFPSSARFEGWLGLAGRR